VAHVDHAADDVHRADIVRGRRLDVAGVGPRGAHRCGSGRVRGAAILAVRRSGRPCSLADKRLRRMPDGRGRVDSLARHRVTGIDADDTGPRNGFPLVDGPRQYVFPGRRHRHHPPLLPMIAALALQDTDVATALRRSDKGIDAFITTLSSTATGCGSAPRTNRGCSTCPPCSPPSSRGRTSTAGGPEALIAAAEERRADAATSHFTSSASHLGPTPPSGQTRHSKCTALHRI